MIIINNVIIINKKNPYIFVMMKNSRHGGHFRELMVGANQCGNHVEWASEQPDRNLE